MSQHSSALPRESSEEKLDRRGIRGLARSPRQLQVQELPGFRGALYRGAKVKDAALDAFVMLGAAADMPFSVFERLSADDSCLADDSAVKHYVALIALRRMMQGLVEPHDAQ